MKPAQPTGTDGSQPDLIGTNVVHFGRLLRRAGMRIGPDRLGSAIDVLARVGISNREDVHAALSCVLVDRHENQPLFDTAFEMYWQAGGLVQPSVQDLLQAEPANTQSKQAPPPSRLTETFHALAGQPDESTTTDFTATFSEEEKLRQQDFASMTREEFAAASRLVRELNLPLRRVRTRRSQAADNGRLDLRRTRQQMMRSPDAIEPLYRERTWQEPPIVVLLDISGSMERYARMFLHFTHGLTRRYARVSTLVFGTRLTNVSRSLRDRDVDMALASASAQVQDWHGGTRIGSSLAMFNRHWARRLLGRNAALILVSDGLDRDDSQILAREAALLRRFARQIIWLNPLLRYDGFEPRASGIRTLLPHADHFLAVHNVNSLAQLGEQLSRGRPASPSFKGTPYAAHR